MYPHLPPGYTVRPPTEEDIPAILALIHDVDIAEEGEATLWTPQTILSTWLDLNPAADAWLVLAPDGKLAGYATIGVEGGGRLAADGYTHPTLLGQGIGTALVEMTEQRAAALVDTQPAGARVVLYQFVQANSGRAPRLLEARGYALARVFFRMQIELKEPPPAPVWPEGIRVRPCDGSQEDIYHVYETLEEGFKDHWDHVPLSFEDWRKPTFIDPPDLALWFLAQDNDQVVGAATCRVRDTGWVTRIAVLRPWRKRGLGLALLLHTFAAFYQRDIRKVKLNVDGESQTGAQRLYERAGMYVAARMTQYEKDLRAGNDLLANP